MRGTWLCLAVVAGLCLAGPRAHAKAPKSSADARALRAGVAANGREAQADVRAEAAALKKTCKALAQDVTSGSRTPREALALFLDALERYLTNCDDSIDTAFGDAVRQLRDALQGAAADAPIRWDVVPGSGGARDSIDTWTRTVRRQRDDGVRTAYQPLGAANACAEYPVAVKLTASRDDTTPEMALAGLEGQLAAGFLEALEGAECRATAASSDDVSFVIRPPDGIGLSLRILNKQDQVVHAVSIASDLRRITVSGLPAGDYRYEFEGSESTTQGFFSVPPRKADEPPPACEASVATATLKNPDLTLTAGPDAAGVPYTLSSGFLTGFVVNLTGTGASTGARLLVTGMFTPGLDRTGAAGTEIIVPVAATPAAGALTMSYFPAGDMAPHPVTGSATLRGLRNIDAEGDEACFGLTAECTVDGRPLELDATFRADDCVERTGAASGCDLKRGQPQAVIHLPLKQMWDYRTHNGVVDELCAICTHAAGPAEGECQWSVSFGAGEGVPTTGISGQYAELDVPAPAGATGGAIVLVRLPGRQSPSLLIAGKLRFYRLAQLGMPGGWVDLFATGMVDGQPVEISTTLRLADGTAR